MQLVAFPEQAKQLESQASHAPVAELKNFPIEQSDTQVPP